IWPLSVRAAGQQPPAPSAIPRVTLTAGRSTVLTVDFDVTRIAITNPAVADAVVVQPREVLIDGRASGTVSLILWGADRRLQYDVEVNAAVTPLQQQLRELFPGEDIQVTVNDEATTLSGHVSSNTVMLRAGEIAAKTSSKTKLINLLQVPGGIESQQVMLQVRFAEVNRQALTELGIALFTGQTKDNIARSTTQQFAAPVFQADGTLTFSDFLNLFLFNTKYDVGALLKALQTRGNLQSLAEPNLIAYNGQEASFLAGGEIPVPVVTGGSGTSTVTVLYKEFGIRLNFTPTIAGDVIRLHVKPEVSTLDFANGVTLNGFRIPALSTRRAETEVELRDGQSFAIAGMLNNVSQETRQAIPIISSLPIVGNFFKSRSDNKQQTELMVLITPHLVRPLDPDEVPALPTNQDRFLPTGGGLVDGPAVATPGATPAAPKTAPKKP
ncbi:MAG: type II and III secretion system protein family protein, partial [Acidobacteriota bacterium]